MAGHFHKIVRAGRRVVCPLQGLKERGRGRWAAPACRGQSPLNSSPLSRLCGRGGGGEGRPLDLGRAARTGVRAPKTPPPRPLSRKAGRGGNRRRPPPRFAGEGGPPAAAVLLVKGD